MCVCVCAHVGARAGKNNDQADAMLEIVRTVEHRRGKYAEITLDTCVHAGSGDVLKVQQMLRNCTGAWVGGVSEWVIE